MFLSTSLLKSNWMKGNTRIPIYDIRFEAFSYYLTNLIFYFGKLADNTNYRGLCKLDFVFKVLFILRSSKIGKKKVWAIICLYNTITKIAGKWGC